MNTRYHCERIPEQYSILNKLPIRLKEGGVLRWHIANFSARIDKFKLILAVQEAFAIWQQGFDDIAPAGRYLTIESTPYFDEADIRIFFCNREHDKQIVIVKNQSGMDQYTVRCPFPFDGRSGVLAHAWPITSDHSFAGNIHCDEEEPWSDMHDNKNVHLLTVLFHEIGHCLNLGHSKVADAIMFPSYSGIKIKLSGDDLAGLEKVWGAYKARFAPESVPLEIKFPKTTAGWVLFAIKVLWKLYRAWKKEKKVILS